MRRWVKVVAALLVLATLLIAIRTLPVADWLEQFKTAVQSLGPAGYVLYVLVYAVCCVFLIPASALTLGAGAIFGFGAGSVVVIIGATLGASAAFLLARTVLRRRVEAMTASNERLAAVDRAIAREGTKVMLLMRLSGFPPFTWINYALGLTGVSFRSYAATTFFGIIPGVLAFTWAGAAGAAALSGRGNRLALIVTAVGAILVSAYIARLATRAIRRDMLVGGGELKIEN
ncbi:MAG TPA: TVP38/TMEM64 family protein [Thermoanaerobaculia bacterium]|nr:TVP38/TMEM64 family protein [Thermoanaerobaculia bacterium]